MLENKIVNPIYTTANRHLKIEKPSTKTALFGAHGKLVQLIALLFETKLPDILADVYFVDWHKFSLQFSDRNIEFL